MKASGCLWNALTVLMIGLTMTACVWVGAVFMNPQGPFNPLKPPVAGFQAATPDADSPLSTPTEAIVFPTLPPEWTATFTPQPGAGTPTVTPAATNTPEPSATVLLSPVGPTATVTDTPTPTATSTVRAPAATQPPGGYPPPTATGVSSYP